jgi:hypothetical protein
MVSIIPISLSMNDSFDTVLIFRFDEFILIRQAILLTIDTFGFSHILPIFGLPFLVACQYSLNKKRFILVRLSQVSSLPGCVCHFVMCLSIYILFCFNGLCIHQRESF